MRKQLYKWGCAGRGPALMAAAVLLGGTLLGACSGSGTEGTGTAAAPGESGPRGGETRGMEDSDGSFNAEGLPILNEPETFTIAVPQRSSLKAAGEKLAAVEAAAATNVHIEWIEIPESGWKEKINIMFSTDSLPDAILGDVDMARNFEQLVVLDEYLASFAPAVTAFFETRDDYPNALRAPDGTIRTLPAGDESIHNIIDSQIWINQKWLDTLGLSMPESTQELKAVLTAFRDLDPNGNGIKDEVPFTFKKSWGWGGTIENMFGYFGVVENGNHVFVKDGRVIFSAREQGYYDALSYLHDLYREGLIDRDVFTISDDQYAARGSAGDTLGMVAGYRAEEAGVLTESDYRALPVLKSGTADGVVGLNNVTREGGFVITNSCLDNHLARRPQLDSHDRQPLAATHHA